MNYTTDQKSATAERQFVLKIGGSGLSAGYGLGNPAGAEREEGYGLRGKVIGYSAAALRREKAWLRSVNPHDLEQANYLGLSATFTMRHCPSSARELSSRRKAFFQSLRRDGMRLFHYSTEWHTRLNKNLPAHLYGKSVPHYHKALMFPGHEEYKEIVPEVRRHYERTFGELGVSQKSQYITPIYDAVGWLKYSSKHTARGLSHIQKSNASIPEEFYTGTGQLWGKGGEWPCSVELMFLMQSEFWRLRDLLQNKTLCEARDVIFRAIGTHFPENLSSEWSGYSAQERKGFIIGYALLHGARINHAAALEGQTSPMGSPHKIITSVRKAYDDIVYARGQKSAVGLLSFVRGVATFQEREVSLLYAEACRRFSRHQRTVCEDKIIKRALSVGEWVAPFKLKTRERHFVSQL